MNGSSNPARTSPGTDRAAGSRPPIVSAPVLSLPKGGGAMRGLGEKFGTNPVNGTGSLTIPIVTSPGRSGFGPQLSLSYDSGSGNGPFGFGWSLGLAAITRRTDKGLPRYLDRDESDVFVLAGSEDLVPVLIQQGDTWVADETTRSISGIEYAIRRYRPRIEGAFARIERWTNRTDAATSSGAPSRRPMSRRGTAAPATAASSIPISRRTCSAGRSATATTIGATPPATNTRKKTATASTSRPRTSGIGRRPAAVSTGIRNASATATAVRIFPTVIHSRRCQASGSSRWCSTTASTTRRLSARMRKPRSGRPVRDPFSTYRAGFEVRTYRLCRRVLMFHHFQDELDAPDVLVRSTDFSYAPDGDLATATGAVFTKLRAVEHAGYVKRSDGAWLRQSLPPLELEYSEAVISDEVREIEVASADDVPAGVDGAKCRWLDLDGEGLAGILTEQEGAFYYKRNLTPVAAPTETAALAAIAAFGPGELIATQPSTHRVACGSTQWLDLAGDGLLDLVDLAGPVPGFYERTSDGDWEPFRAFTSQPRIDWVNPSVRLVDLTGDGHPDVLITEDEALWWHPSLAEAGFAEAEKVWQALDETDGPRVLFSDGTESIQLADMSGDGSMDIVRIRNGEICYWPNLGYGRFGARVIMDASPWFDHPDVFDHARVRLADIDGTGLIDIIYLGREGVDVYVNQSGNRWSPAQRLTAFPSIDDAAAIEVVDLLGNGTACLVWSSPLPEGVGRQMRYVDLMGGQKPHLLIRIVNNLGAERTIGYAASTRFYLADKLAGRPWITRLPFPVHVVERVETIDRISGNCFVTRFAYHHGYFDGVEREFRGFGLVEEWDTEELASLAARAGAAPNLDEASHVPPVLTRSWFHTGVYFGRDRVSNFYSGLADERDTGEYYREPGASDDEARALLLDDTILPDGLTPDEEREACRALKGAMLRQEIYALDGTDRAGAPVHRHRAELHGPHAAAARRQSSCGLSDPRARGGDVALRAEPGRSAHEPRVHARDGCLRQRPESRLDWLRAQDSRPGARGGRSGQTDRAARDLLREHVHQCHRRRGRVSDALGE